MQHRSPKISTVDILILIFFFTFLWIPEYVSAKVVRAGIIGPIAVGIIYGEPLANILHHDWAETFLYLANFTLSILGAATGVIFPIAFSYLLLFIGFGYGAVETFIIGAALSTTSLGTTFAVISSASKSVDLSQNCVGAVLVSAAVFDNVTGLIISSVIHDLGEIFGEGDVSLGWLVGRPIVASASIAVLTPILTKWVFAPFIEHHFAKFDHLSNITLMILVLSAFISIASFAGTSLLFGPFLAGTFLTYLPSKHPKGPFAVMSRGKGERPKHKSPTFVHTFEYYCLDAQ